MAKMYMGFWRCLLHFFIILGVKVEKGVERFQYCESYKAHKYYIPRHRFCFYYHNGISGLPLSAICIRVPLFVTKLFLLSKDQLIDAGAGVEQVDYFLDDNYNSLKRVIEALASASLESSNLIVGIDFTKSNEWTSARSFQRRCLHHIGHEQNPYEQAISIIGKTLPSFDEDKLIPVLDSEMRQHMTKKFLVSMMMIDFVMDLKKC
ncbi:RING-type E3 ubiquitin transferase [Trifolium repens]|nr:RING-type E3 ubiquitin transferase [Trifolium repens]